MTPAEVAAWAQTNDMSELIRTGEPAVGLDFAAGPLLDERDLAYGTYFGDQDAPRTLVSMRLPSYQIEALDRLAGRDREGRSGVVRAAVASYLRQMGVEPPGRQEPVQDPILDLLDGRDAA